MQDNKERISVDIEAWKEDMVNRVREAGAKPLDFPSIFVKFPDEPDFMISLNRINDKMFVICCSKENEVIVTEYYSDAITAKERLTNLRQEIPHFYRWKDELPIQINAFIRKV